MLALAWFVEQALVAAGRNPDTWEGMPYEERVSLLRAWGKSIGSTLDFVRLARLKKEATTPEENPYIVISFKTAEYFSCLAGHVPWGSQKRRAEACYELGFAMQGLIRSTSLECFQDQTWEIITKKK